MKYSTALYCRLSREDLESTKNVSDSIENQRLLLEHYINNHSDEFIIYDTYIDDGITGMTYDREAFNRMMTAVYEKKINCIIVKDLSRIGREQVETLNLIRKEFVLHNVRFIALTDDYDSLNPSKSDSLSTSVKLLLNDYYCADISKKVRAAQRAKMENGDFIGAYAPYGYAKSPENHNKLIIDGEAAEVVKRIFQMYANGMGKIAIARQLNSYKIPNPTAYKRNVKKLNYSNGNKLASTNYWTYSTIDKILRNRAYAGDTVQHKSEVKAYNIHKKTTVPSEKWCISENTHEAIIDKESFNIVQNMLKIKRRQIHFDENNSKYMGLFFCKDCGRRMNKFLSKPKKDGSRYVTFKCGSYSQFGKDICTIHSIKESDLDEIVINEIKKAVTYALDANACEYIKKNSFSKIKNNNREKLKRLGIRLNECENKRLTMLKYLSEGVITTEDFKIFDSENKTDIDNINCQIMALNEKLENEEQQSDEFDSWLNKLVKYKDIQEVTREILVNLVDKIYISETENTKAVEIVFKYKNPIG